MTSGPGTTGKTDVPPDEAIEEISGLLEMDELSPGDRRPLTAPSSRRRTVRGLPHLAWVTRSISPWKRRAP
jgi:hypothetical protein